MRKVVVTGLGVVSAFGIGRAPFWDGLARGRSAIGELGPRLAGDESRFIGAELAGFDASQHLERATISVTDRFCQFALIAAAEAVADAGVAFEGEAGLRAACVIGTGIGGTVQVEENYHAIFAKGKKRPHPFLVPRIMPNAPAGQISMAHGLRGPSYGVVTACASGGHAIGQAMHLIRSGAVDAAVAGGAEACLTLGGMKSWEALKVLAPDTCRPFSKNRSGLVLGEGAGIAVLEAEERARARAAPIYAELAGFGMTADAGDIVLPTIDGPARAMEMALRDGGFAGAEIAYVNAHGTGTAANDRTETAALKQVFGDHAGGLVVSSTKSMHGHALGAAAALEFVATVLAMKHGLAPPTANYDEADPELDLDYAPNEAREMAIDAAMSNAFAFGGLNACLTLRAAR